MAQAAKLTELFPTLAGHARGHVPRELPGFDGDPFDYPFDAMLFLQALLLAAETTQLEAQRRAGLAALEQVSLTILEELRAARAIEEEGALFLKWVRLSVAALVAEAAYETGDIGRTHEWLMRALVEDYRNGEENLTEIDTLAGALAAPQLLVGSIVTDAVLKWLATLFAHGVRSGDLKDLADDLFDVPEKMLAEGLVQLASFPGLVAAMLVARADWAIRYRPADSANATRHVVAARESGNLSAKERAAIDVFLPADATVAKVLLVLHRAVLDPSQRIHLRLKAADGDAAQLRAMHDVLLVDITELRLAREKAAKTPTERMLRGGQAFRLLHPLIRIYAEAGDVSGVIEVLTAWSDAPTGAPVRAPLLGLTAHPVGTIWASTAVVPTDRTPRETLGAFISAMNALLDLSILHGDDPIMYWPEREQLHPHPEHSTAYVNASLAMMRLDALAGLPRPLPSSILLVPGQTVPIQPLLLRELDHAAALNVSMKEAGRPRALRRAALFGEDGANSFSSLLEIGAIEALLRSRGVHVDRLPSTAAAFTTAYVDPAYDLIWVAAHGEHRGYRLEESAVVLGDHEAVALDALAELRAPPGDRRALVLNICSGGMSATLGGPLGLGLGPVLAGPTQSVFTHLWPVAWQFAAAYGGLLALSLATGVDHLEAYAAALRTVLLGRDATVAALAEAAELTVITERLNDQIDFTSVLSWGAPVLLT